MARREILVEVALDDGNMLLGGLILRDSERVVLRDAYWLYTNPGHPAGRVRVPLDTSRPPTENARHAHMPWQQYVEVDASEVLLVTDGLHNGDKAADQKWDMTSWPASSRTKNPRWWKAVKVHETRINPPLDPTFDQAAWLAERRLRG